MREVAAGARRRRRDALLRLAVERGHLRHLGAEAGEDLEQLLHVVARGGLVEGDAEPARARKAQVDAGFTRLGEVQLGTTRHAERQGVEEAVVLDGDAEAAEARRQDEIGRASGRERVVRTGRSRGARYK